MIEEVARVVRVEKDCLWVEGTQESTCGACHARAGCGQQLLAKLTSRRPLLRVLPDNRPPAEYRVGETLTIVIPERVVVNGSLLIYFGPLLSLLLVAGLAETLFAQDIITLIAGLIGLLLGGLLVKIGAARTFNSKNVQPFAMAEALTFQRAAD